MFGDGASGGTDAGVLITEELREDTDVALVELEAAVDAVEYESIEETDESLSCETDRAG